MGGDWLSENVMLANRASGTRMRGWDGRRKEVLLGWGYCEVKRPWNVQPPPGAGEETWGEGKKKEEEHEIRQKKKV